MPTVAKSPTIERPRARPAERTVVGWREWVGLPSLGVSHIKAKFDTGARTSSLHAFDLETFKRGEDLWVRFNIHPAQRDTSLSIACEERVVDRRFVTNSGGHREQRYIILTDLRVGDRVVPIELTLANRDEMGFRMLVGRSAMSRWLVVDPARSFTSQGTKSPRAKAPPTKVPRTKAVPKHAEKAIFPSDEEE